jgi:hypothetical protein
MLDHRNLLIKAAIIVGSAAASCYGGQPLSAQDRSSIQLVVTQLKEAILQEDTHKLLSLISNQIGLTCTDSKYSQKQISGFLKDKTSYLYLSLFDSKGYSQRCGGNYPPEFPAISEKEFLSKASRPTIEITPIEAGWAKVVYKSETKGHYQREWVFHKESGSWKIAEGFIIGNCSCG